MECGVGNELQGLIRFFNERYAGDDFNKIDFKEVQRIAGTCVTGCTIVDPAIIENAPVYRGFSPKLAQRAKNTALNSHNHPSGAKPISAK
jgi:hypothetical protein